MEDEQEVSIQTSKVVTGEVNETGNSSRAAEESSILEAGFVPRPIKSEAAVDMESAYQEFQELLVSQGMKSEIALGDTSVDEDRKEGDMEVDQENDLDEAAVPRISDDKSYLTTPTNLRTRAEVENSLTLENDEEDAGMSSEETVSSSSFTSPNNSNEFNETNEKSKLSVAKPEHQSPLQVNELEEQVKALQDLLILKEKEWNVILRLKKHTEYVLEQAKCGRRIAKTQTSFNDKMSMTDDDKNTWMSLITTNSIGSMKNAKKITEDSVKKIQSECIALETAFPFGSSMNTSTPKIPFQGRDSTENGEKNGLVATELGVQSGSKEKTMMKPSFKQAPKLPASKPTVSSTASPTTLLQGLQMSGVNDLGPFMRTMRDIAANKNKLKSSSSFKPVRMTTADRRFRYQKVIDKLKTEANKLRKAANSGNPSRPAVQQSARSKSSRQPAQNAATTTTGERSVVVTFSSGRREVVTQQSYRPETPVQGPICQGCHSAPSEYMCSICKDQWYCSRECQLKDWDEHSEFCSS